MLLYRFYEICENPLTFLRLRLPCSVLKVKVMAAILAVDTSSDACSVALMHDSECFSLSVDAPREHTQRLLPMIDELLSSRGVALAELDAIAYGRGPGSFTGLRIGLGTVQGLAYAADIPVLPISTLQAMAVTAQRLHNFTAEQPLLVALDARMSEVYWGHFDAITAQPLSDEYVAAPSNLADYLCAQGNVGSFVGLGPGWHYPELQALGLPVEYQDITPQAEDILSLALLEWNAGRAIAVEEAQPTYLRDSVAWKKRKRIRKPS